MNVFIVISCVFSVAWAMSVFEVRAHPATPKETSGTAMAYALVGFTLAAALCFRRHAYLPIAIAACIPPLFMPLDALPALIAAASFIVWAKDLRAAAGVTILAAVTTFVSLWRDTRAAPAGGSAFGDFFSTAPRPHATPDAPVWQVLLLTTVFCSMFFGIAFLRRNRKHLHAAEQSQRTAQAQVHNLEEHLADQFAREDIAREVHDVLGHRLSILSMQANVLDAMAQESDDPEMRHLARQIQQGSAGSMDDLRSLLTMMRTGEADPQAPGDLSGVAQLVSECVSMGVNVSSAIFVQDAQSVHPAIGRTAHRVTAEILTNVRKHAPQFGASLNISGCPRDGLTIRCENRLGNAPAAVGTNSGLNGIRRRVESLGGTFTAGPDVVAGRFQVQVWLPWAPAPRQPSPAAPPLTPTHS